jgi:hypothetical protein
MLSNADREWVREHVANHADQIAEAVVTKALSVHVELCPHGKVLGRYTVALTGVAALVGAILPATLQWAFKHFGG